jgi:hypothetical protein
VFGTLDRLRRVVALEKEHLEDLVAEGKAKHEASLRRPSRVVSAAAEPGDAPVPRVRAA